MVSTYSSHLFQDIISVEYKIKRVCCCLKCDAYEFICAVTVINEEHGLLRLVFQEGIYIICGSVISRMGSH